MWVWGFGGREQGQWYNYYFKKSKIKTHGYKILVNFHPVLWVCWKIEILCSLESLASVWCWTVMNINTFLHFHFLNENQQWSESLSDSMSWFFRSSLNLSIKILTFSLLFKFHVYSIIVFSNLYERLVNQSTPLGTRKIRPTMQISWSSNRN